MKRSLGMVDGNFFVRSACRALHLDPDTHDVAIDQLSSWFRASAKRLDSSLLRLYWYDAIVEPKFNQMYQKQRDRIEKIDSSSGVQVRLGRLEKRSEPWRKHVYSALEAIGASRSEFDKALKFEPTFEQKGVDSSIVLDVVRLAEKASYETLILIAGDGDLAGAIKEAQDLGREVVLAFPERNGVSSSLLKLADQAVVFEKEMLSRFIRSTVKQAEKSIEGGA